MRKIILLLLILSYQYSNACSAFFFNSENKILAKNFDWISGQGYLIKNIRGQQKFAYGFRGENVAKWISKFGSITFNQIGKEFPYGGINEKGLVIEQLWLTNSEYPENRNNVISELEWIQYQLDNYSNVDEVIKNIHSLTIKPNATVHFILADKNGVSAVIDFVNGKSKIDRQQNKFQVITNETFEDSKKYFEVTKNIDLNSRNAFDRYCILKNNLNVDNLDISNSFAKLDSVKENQENYKTYWSIVYDINNLTFYYKSFDNQKMKKVSLSDFDFDKNSRIEFSFVNSNGSNFQLYTEEDNKKLLTDAMKMMNLEIDIEKANAHQMNPSKVVVDEIYKNKYSDLLVEFLTKKVSGNIWFTIAKGENQFKTYNGFKKGVFPVTSKINRKMFYGLPKGGLAIACFQDTDNDSKMDKNIVGIPTNTGFSNNKKKIFGIPPNYETAKIILEEPKIIQIKIN